MRETVGFGRGDLTVYEPQMAMLGWGIPDQFPTGVGAPLQARAMVLSGGKRVRALVSCDLCFISAALRAEVRARLGASGISIADADLMLLATHTHSGPNGYHHAFFYDLSGPGFSPRVLEGLANGIVAAIAEGIGRAEPVVLSYGEASVARGVAFNRALVAHRLNPEATGPATPADAVSRTLQVLKVDTPGGSPRGVVAVFGLHATSVHGDQHLLHPDHKGLAASALEAERGPEFVALFVQGAAGDVSPNARFDQARGVTVGPRKDDLANAARAAQAEVAAAREAMNHTTPIGDGWRSGLLRVDFEDRLLPDEFAPPGTRTSRARLGVAMAAGTREGPGPLAPLAAIVRAARARSGDAKRVLLQVGPIRGPRDRRRLLGVVDPTRGPIPHPAFARARHLQRAGALGDLAWIPTILPVQRWRLGDLTLVALPNEPTTVVGARITRQLEDEPGVRRAIVLGYANAYSGYLTTPEEYGAQRYEGAYTLFGPHTLGAYREAIKLTKEVVDGRDEGPETPICDPVQARARAV